MMAKIIEEAEKSISEFPRPSMQEQLKVAETVAELVCHAVARAAHETHRGFHAQWFYRAAVSRYRPLVPSLLSLPKPIRAGAWR